MRCLRCGTDVPDGALVCPKCGSPTPLVPDYTSLENLLADEVKEALGEKPTAAQPGVSGETVFVQNTSASYDPEDDDMTIYESPSREAERFEEEDAARRRRIRKAQEERRRRRNRKITIGIAAGLSVVILGILIFLGTSVVGSTYSSQMKKGDRSFDKGAYEKAEKYYQQAADANPKKADPLVGLGKCCLVRGDNEKAEQYLLEAIKLEPDNSSAYDLLARYYLDSGQLDKIPEIFADVKSKKVLKACAAYVSPTPVISPDAGNFAEETEVTIKADGGTIHYTTDLSKPTADSPAYSEPIKLTEDGQYTIRAITINDKGIAGQEATAVFNLELPLIEGPSVTPASGNYEGDEQIKVSVPEGMTVYYTLDGSTPTTESDVYDGPIDMPQDDTTFSCIAVSETGRQSSVIKRKYTRY